MILTEYLYKRPIICQVTELNGDISVLLFGGDKAHLGAVSLAGGGMETVTNSFPGHKEQHITHVWAEKIAATTGKHVCVQGGIHYEGATEDMIREIMAVTDRMLEEILTRMG